ncbi:MAG TPA: PLDc N-terminal domain-containing protein [Gaiellaceae bacterium]
MTPVAESYQFLDVLWTMFIFLAWLSWVAFLLFLLVDNFRRDDHSGLAKAGWTVALIFVPVIGAIAYMIARPPTRQVAY